MQSGVAMVLFKHMSKCLHVRLFVEVLFVACVRMEQS